MEELVKILVVEDDATIRTLLEMALLGAGFKDVKSSARGDEGLDAIKRTKPDLVLLDLMLPGLDGFAIAKRIREMPELAATKIIMLTARTQNEDIVRGLSCGLCCSRASVRFFVAGCLSRRAWILTDSGSTSRTSQ